jgi:hypothetical protein
MKRVLKEQICSEFTELMDADPPHPEEVFHQFMVKYPALIPVWRPLEGVVYSKFKLGTEHVTDFAFVRDDTPGLRWTFIEIEKPSDRLLRKNRLFSRNNLKTAPASHVSRLRRLSTVMLCRTLMRW